MRCIKISGYFQNNVGDDLMIEILMSRYPNITFWGYKENQKKSIRMQKANYISADDLYKKYGKINHLLNIITLYQKKDFFIHCIVKYIENHCCCAVGIGGSLYAEWDSSIEERLQYEDLKRIDGKPYYILGANFGPYSNPNFLRAFKKYFQTCSTVSFRDKSSFKMFRNLPMVQWAPDIVFNIKKENICDKNTVLISVVDINESKHVNLKDYSKMYYEFIGNLCETVIEREQIPVLVSFCKAEGDEHAIIKILNNLSPLIKDKIRIHLYDGNTEKILNLFRSAHYVIATRFHAMILAMKFQKPFFAISYDPKLVNVLKDMQLKSYCEFKDLGEVSIETVLGQKNEISEEYIDEITKQAEKHFEELDNFLKLCD